MAGKMVRARTLGTLALLGLAACGGAPAGPSPIADGPPPATVAAPAAATTPRPIPAGLDPAYVRTIATVDAQGQPKRWGGGPFHHCFSVTDADQLALAQEAATRITSLSGVPRTEVGPCNVEWVTMPDVGHTQTWLSGDAAGYTRAKIDLRGTNARGLIMHEAGHVLGLEHSPRPHDLMNKNTPPEGDFSADELAVLAWIYGR